MTSATTPPLRLASHDRRVLDRDRAPEPFVVGLSVADPRQCMRARGWSLVVVEGV